MNVYLHHREKFRAYLQRLQNQADEKPLLLGEYGIDSIRNGEDEQAELLGMHLEEVFRCGLAGTCVFSYTDEWFTGGHPITDWAFGLVRRDRSPKPAFHRVAEVFRGPSPLPPLPRYPKVSVVVCSYNGAKTLDGCLRSLQKLDYPDYEVILVNDGSTDSVPEIAARYPVHPLLTSSRTGACRVARNVGMELAARRGHRLHRRRLLRRRGLALLPGGEAAGDRRLRRGRAEPAAHRRRPGRGLRLGEPGHARPRADRRQRGGARARLQHGVLGRPAARASAASTPSTRRPATTWTCAGGCRRRARPIVYAPAAMVWHHRRATVQAYLKQQRGYGEAEGLLKRKHPEKFRGFRADLSWLGRIYTRAGLGLERGPAASSTTGVFGAGMFQTIYAAPQVWWPLLALSLEWWLLVVPAARARARSWTARLEPLARSGDRWGPGVLAAREPAVPGCRC